MHTVHSIAPSKERNLFKAVQQKRNLASNLSMTVQMLRPILIASREAYLIRSSARSHFLSRLTAV